MPPSRFSDVADPDTNQPVVNWRRESIELDPNIPAWEIQPDEPAEAYDMFRQYRDMGYKRTIVDIARAALALEQVELGQQYDAARHKTRMKSTSVVVTRYASRFRWQDRVKAYDAHLDRIAVKEAEEAIRASTRRQAQVAAGIIGLAGGKLKYLFDERGKKEIESMTIGELLACAGTGIRLERLILGVDDAPRPDDVYQTADQPRSLEEAKRIARQAAIDAVSTPDPEPPTGPPPSPKDDNDPDPEQ